MKDILKKLGYKTITGKWDTRELLTDLVVLTMFGIIIYVAILIK